MGFIARKFEKRQLYHVSDPEVGTRIFGLKPSISGTSVDSNSVMSLSAVWAAINFYATVIGSLPLHLYRDVENGKSKAKDNPKYNMMKRFTNSEMTAMTYREYIITSTLLFGKGYSEKAYDGTGRLRELWPIPFYRVTPDRVGGKKIYTIVLKDGTSVTLSRDEMFEVVGPSNGTCVYTLLKETFGLSLALNEFAARFFGGGANPGVIVSHPETLSPTAHKNLKDDLTDKYSGLSKAHRLLLLDEGMKIDKIGNTPEESQAIESRGFQINEVARIFNLAPHILRELSKSSFNNIEQQSLETVIYSLSPMCVRLEQQMDMDLLTASEKKNMRFVHNIEGLLRGDTESRAEFYKNMFLIGAYSINDILKLESRNTIGPDGDKRFVMSNMAPIDKLENIYAKRSLDVIDHMLSGKPETRVLPYPAESRKFDISKRDKVLKKMSPLFKKDFQRIVNKESKAIKKAIKKKDLNEFREWIAEFYKNFPEYVVENIQDTFSVYAETMKDVILDEIEEDTADIEQRIEDFTSGFANRYSEDSQGQILSLLEKEEFKEEIVRRSDEWIDKKAEKQTKRETVSLMGMVSRAVILGAGYKLKWKTRSKSCPYCNNLNGKTVASFSESFCDAGDEIEGDDELKMVVKRRTKYPQLHKSCDCFLTKE